MPAIRAFVALCLGYAVQKALVFAGGVAAAQATPPGYFEYFGRQNLDVALGLWSISTFAVPQFVLAALLAWGALRLFKLTRSLAYAFVAGALLCWLHYMIYVPSQDGSAVFATMPQFLAMVKAIYFHNAWQLPASWASWFGLLAAVFFAFKRSNSTSPPRAEA
jgi:hypothetical protein